MKKWKMNVCFAVGALSVLTMAGCSIFKSFGVDTNVKTITIWSLNAHSKVYYEDAINDYNDGEGKDRGIRIDYKVIEGETFTQSLEIALQNGEAPDMFENVGIIPQLVENDLIVAIDDLEGGREFLKKYDGGLYPNSNTYKGKTYTVPSASATQGLLYNKDMFKAAGLVDENGEATPPETFDELVEYAKILTDKEKRQFGIIFPFKWSGWFESDILYPMMSSFGHKGYDPVADEYNYMPLVPIIQAFLDIKADGSVFPGDEIDNDTARALFAAGNIGMKFGFSFDVGVLESQFPTSCEWSVAPYPVVDINNKYLQVMDHGSTFCINKKSLETVGGEALMEVLRFITDDEFLSDKYKKGIDLPYDWSIVENCELDVDKSCWKEFAKLANISIKAPVEPKTYTDKKVSMQERFINEVWNGKTSPEEFCRSITKSKNKARETYYSMHTNENSKEAANPNWDIRR